VKRRPAPNPARTLHILRSVRVSIARDFSTAPQPKGGTHMDLPRYLRAPEAARLVGGVHPNTLFRWAAEGRFPHPVLIGPNTRGWRDDVLMKWMKSRPVKEAA